MDDEHGTEAVAIVDRGHFFGGSVRCRLLRTERPAECARGCMRYHRCQMLVLWRSGVPEGPARQVFAFLRDPGTPLARAAAVWCHGPEWHPWFWADDGALVVPACTGTAWVFAGSSATASGVQAHEAELGFTVARRRDGGGALLVLSVRRHCATPFRAIAASQLDHTKHVREAERLVRRGGECSTWRLLRRLRDSRAVLAQTQAGSGWEGSLPRRSNALLVPADTGGGGVVVLASGCRVGAHGFSPHEARRLWVRDVATDGSSVVALASGGTDVLWCLSGGGLLVRLRLWDGTPTAAVTAVPLGALCLRHALCLRPVGGGRVVCCVDPGTKEEEAGTAMAARTGTHKPATGGCCAVM